MVKELFSLSLSLSVSLVPETCVEVTEALQFFTSRFEGRYGAMHPLFFIGALKEAVREATSGVGTVSTLELPIKDTAKKEKKILKKGHFEVPNIEVSL